MLLTEEIKNTLIEYNNINTERNNLLFKLECQFKPLIKKAYENKDVMELIQIKNTLPNSDLCDQIQIKIFQLLKREMKDE